MAGYGLEGEVKQSLPGGPRGAVKAKKSGCGRDEAVTGQLLQRFMGGFQSLQKGAKLGINK